MCIHARILTVSQTDKLYLVPSPGLVVKRRIYIPPFCQDNQGLARSDVDGRTPCIFWPLAFDVRASPEPSHAPAEAIHVCTEYLSMRDIVLPDPRSKYHCSFVSDIHPCSYQMRMVNEAFTRQLGGTEAVQAWFDLLKETSQACVDACQASVKSNSTAPLAVLKRTVTSMTKPQPNLKGRPTPPAPWDVTAPPALTKYKIPKAPKPAKPDEKPLSKAKAPKAEHTKPDRKKKSKHRDKRKHVESKDKRKSKDKPAVADPRDKLKPRKRQVLRDSPPRQRERRSDIVKAKLFRGPISEAVIPLADSNAVYIRRGPRTRESRATKHGSPESKPGSIATSVDRNNNRR